VSRFRVVIVILMLAVLALPLTFYINYTITVTPKNMNIAPLNQALADMQKDTAVRKASARYHRSSHVYITLYTD
jgi:hypothetical protein